MTCCGKTKKAFQKDNGAIEYHPYLSFPEGYEFTNTRVRACRRCDWSFWIARRLFCRFRLRRFGATLWADPLAYVPGFARIKNEKCFLGNWKGED